MKRARGQPGRPGPGPGAGRSLVGWLVGSIALVLVVTAYLPLRHADYIQDDHLAVEQNPIVARGDPVEILSSSYWAGARGQDRSLYRPVTVLSYAVERRLRGRPDPLLAHGINLALHLLASMTLFALAWRIGAGVVAAAASSLLFAVHPVHVEAVASVVGRAELLAALFSFCSLLALSAAGPWGVDRAWHPRWPRGRLAAWAAAAFLLLALGSKEIALATPLLLALVELLFRPAPGARRSWEWLRERVRRLLPSAVALAIYLGARAWVLGTPFALQQAHPADNILVRLDGLERAYTALGLVTRSVGLFIFPVGLSIDYSGYVVSPEASPWSWRPLAGLLLLAGAALLILRPLLRLRSASPAGSELLHRQLALASALFLLPYLVIGNLLTTVGTIFAERLLYLPSAGFCLLLGLTLDRLARTHGTFPQWTAERRAHTMGAALVILVAAFSLLTWQRATEWRNDETVFAAAVRTQPRSPRAHFILGKARLEAGERDEALALFDRTLELWPEHVPALVEKGIIHAHPERGELEVAERAFREAVRVSPRYAKAHLNLGIALHHQGRRVEAEASVNESLRLDPESARAWAELGHLRFEGRRFGAAAEAYWRAVSLGRDDLLPRAREAEARAR